MTTITIPLGAVIGITIMVISAIGVAFCSGVLHGIKEAQRIYEGKTK